MSQRALSEPEIGAAARVNASVAEVATRVRQVGALNASELAEVSQAARGVQSGAFKKQPDAATVPDWSALRLQAPQPLAAEPIDGRLPVAPERAELPIADVDLHVANPFLGSSLLPPPLRKTGPWLKPLLLTAAGCALIGAGYSGAVWRARDTAPRVPTTAAVASRPKLPSVAAPAILEPKAAAVHASEPVKTVVDAPASAATPPTALPSKATPRAAAPGRGHSQVGQPTQVEPRAVPAVGERAAKRERTASETRPQQLTRAQVQTGLESTRGALQTCAAGAHGQIVASVSISGAGRVTHAFIEGGFAGTPQGSCMARALRGAQFPAFTSAQLRVRYPFVF